eukprot:6475026-Amphidinium_carterae.1
MNIIDRIDFPKVLAHVDYCWGGMEWSGLSSIEQVMKEVSEVDVCKLSPSKTQQHSEPIRNNRKK